MSYDANNLVSLSDHRPVFAQFYLYLSLSDVAEFDRNEMIDQHE